MELSKLIDDIRETNRRLEHRQNGRTYIPVQYDEGNNWEFAVLDAKHGKRLAVF